MDGSGAGVLGSSRSCLLLLPASAKTSMEITKTSDPFIEWK